MNLSGSRRVDNVLYGQDFGPYRGASVEWSDTRMGSKSQRGSAAPS